MRNIIYTDHALLRMAQRGVSDTQVERVLQYGRKIYNRGALVVFVGKREIRRLAGFVDDIHELEGLHVIVNTECVVITAYRNRSTVFRVRG
jgi:hypothetical protein